MRVLRMASRALTTVLAVGLWAGVLAAPAVGTAAGRGGAGVHEAGAGLAPDRSVDPDQIARRLLDERIVRLPGSIARFDEATVRGEVTATGTDVAILVAPVGPLDSAENRAYQDRLRDVEDAMREQWRGRLSDGPAADDGDAADAGPPELITITGLSLSMGILTVAPDDLASLRMRLESYELTPALTFALHYLADGTEPDSDPVPVEVATDPAVFAQVEARLRDDPVWVDPRVADSTGMSSAGLTDDLAGSLDRWQDETGTTARVVVLPPETGDGLDVDAAELAADLADAFPDDVVLLFRGRWLEVSGPAGPESGRRELAQARTMVLSQYRDFLLARDIAPDNVMTVLADRFVDLTSGSVTGQVVPTRPNPLRWLLVALPVLAAGLIIGFAVRHRGRRERSATAQRHVAVADRAAAAAALPDLAAGILALDGLTQDGPPAALVDRAVERYLAARELVLADQDPGPALAAIDDSRDALRDAAAALGVPAVPGLDGSR